MKTSNLFKIIVGILALSVLAFGAGDQLGEIENIVTDTDATAKSTMGIAFTWVVSAIAPLATMVIASVVGFTSAKKKIDQSQEGGGKLLAIVAGYAIAGAFAYYVAVSLFFAMITGDLSNGFTVITNFWKEIFGL